MFVATELGAFIRSVLVSYGDFPLNDGGLFYVMAQDIARSGFTLPAFSSYNGINMPFAYPPLGFYLGAILSAGLRWPLIEAVRLVPIMITIVTIPAFYLFSRTILKSDVQAVIAMFAFALLPRAFKFLIMGGGLTRAPGFLFSILAMQQGYLLYTTRNRRYLLPTIILSGLIALAHPEIALYTALSLFLFFVFCGRNRQGAIHSLIASVGVIILTAPWWLSVVSQHGIGPFLAAFQTGEQSFAVTIGLLLTGVGFVEQTLLGVLALLGAIHCIASRRYLLPVWLVSIFVIAPRSAQTFAVAVVPLLIAIELDEVILPEIERVIGTATVERRAARRATRIAKAALGFMLIVYSAFTALGTSIPILAKEERAAMAWAGTNTPGSSEFAIITGYNWYEDTISEWFPVLSGRRSLATVQGYEWFPNREFMLRQEQHKSLQKCIEEDVSCLSNWAGKNAIDLTYVYISTGQIKDSPLLETIKRSPEYVQVYAGPDAVIYRRQKRVTL